MDSIRHLLPQAGREIFDPEKMTIEILSERLQELVSDNHFSTLKVRDMRAMALDVAGRPREETSWCSPLPEILNRLHCIHYDKLSPINRRQCFREVFKYLRIDESNGAELLGHDRWQELMRLIDAKCSNGESASENDSNDAEVLAAGNACASEAFPCVDGDQASSAEPDRKNINTAIKHIT